MKANVVRIKTTQDITNGITQFDKDKNEYYSPVEITITLFANPKAGKQDVLNAIKSYLDSECNWQE